MRRRADAALGPASSTTWAWPTQLAKHHRFDGLRSIAFGHTLEMRVARRTPTTRRTATSSPATTSTTSSPSGPRRRARRCWDQTEATAPIVESGLVRGAVVKRKETGAIEEIRARYVVVADGSTSRFGRALGASRNRLPAGHGDPRLLHLRPPRRAVDRVAPRHPRHDGQRAARLRLDLPGGRRADERRHRAAVHVPPVEGDQHHAPDGRVRRRTATATSRGASAGDVVRPADRRPPADGVLGRAASRADLAVTGDAGGAINPFNGEGIAYAYETGRHRRRGVATRR